MGLLYITSEGSAPGALWEGAQAFQHHLRGLSPRGSLGGSTGLPTSPQRAQPQGLSGREHGPSLHHLRGLSPRGSLGKARTLRRIFGKSLVQSRCTSRVSFLRVSLINLVIPSTFSEDWGRYGM